jgi:hypothetical protein
MRKEGNYLCPPLQRKEIEQKEGEARAWRIKKWGVISTLYHKS